MIGSNMPRPAGVGGAEAAAILPQVQQMERAGSAEADPLQRLPAAIITDIFARLDTRSLLQAGQVSRSWRHAADDLPALQARLRQVALRRPLAPADLRLLALRQSTEAAAAGRPSQLGVRSCFCTGCFLSGLTCGSGCLLGGCLAGTYGVQLPLFLCGFLSLISTSLSPFVAARCCRQRLYRRQPATPRQQPVDAISAEELSRLRELERAAAPPPNLAAGPTATAAARRRLKLLLQQECSRLQSILHRLVAAAAGDAADKHTVGPLLGLLGDSQLAGAIAGMSPAQIHAVALALIDAAQTRGLQRLHPFVPWDLAATATAAELPRTPAMALDDAILYRAAHADGDVTVLEVMLGLRPAVGTPLRPQADGWLQAARAFAAQPSGSCPQLAVQLQWALQQRLDSGRWDELAELEPQWPALCRLAPPGRPSVDARLRQMLQGAVQQRNVTLLVRAHRLLPLVFGGAQGR